MATLAFYSLNLLQNQKTQNANITLLAAGDFIAHDSINTWPPSCQMVATITCPLWTRLRPSLKNDIRFCSDGVLNGGTQFGVSGYPKFNSPTEFVDGMTKVGCNLVANGTNHSFDRDQSVINATADAWARQTKHAGSCGPK